MSAPSTVSDPSTTTLRFGRCELLLQTRELRVSGRPEPVRRRVFDLMAFLVAQRHRVVSHHELLRQVWGSAQVSPKMLARAVMEARRACGDPAEEPGLFVSVRGVGYRFVGTLTEASTSPSPADTAVEDPSEVRSLLRRARQALDAGRLDEAQVLAAEAQAGADRGPSHADRVQALVLRSSMAMRRGTAAEAARLAAHALQIARAEGQPQLVAQARLAVGYVHLVEGDRALAIRHFEESREALSARGHERDLLTCLNRLAMAFRDTGKPESGLQMNRRALVLARQLRDPDAILIARNNEVMFLLYIGDRQSAEGQAAAARKTFEEALALVDGLLQDQPAGAGSRQRQSALGNRAFVLQRLGRLDEAWSMLSELEVESEGCRWLDSPIHAERQMVTRELRATLLADAGRHDEALELLGQSVEAAVRLGRHGALPRLYGLAGDIAERAGRLAQALRWVRLQGDAQVALRASEASALALILEAEMNAENLQAELHRARAQVAALQQENAGLRQRAELMQGAAPVAADTGLAGSEQLTALFSARHHHARVKGLPMCLGLLEWAPDQPLAPAALRGIAEVLAAQADIAYPAVDQGAVGVVFRIRDAGPSHAAEVCRRVLDALERQTWSRPGTGQPPSWRCRSADAACFGSIEQCIQSLAHRSPTPDKHMADE